MPSAISRPITRRSRAVARSHQSGHADRGRAEHLGEAVRTVSALRVHAAASACSPSSRRACIELAIAARDGGIALTVDAEEAERLELSLELIERVARSPQLAGWNGFGLAVQAYQKRALDVMRWLRELARLDESRA